METPKKKTRKESKRATGASGDSDDKVLFGLMIPDNGQKTSGFGLAAQQQFEFTKTISFGGSEGQSPDLDLSILNYDRDRENPKSHEILNVDSMGNTNKDNSPYHKNVIVEMNSSPSPDMVVKTAPPRSGSPGNNEMALGLPNIIEEVDSKDEASYVSSLGASLSNFCQFADRMPTPPLNPQIHKKTDTMGQKHESREMEEYKRNLTIQVTTVEDEPSSPVRRMAKRRKSDRGSRQAQNSETPKNTVLDTVSAGNSPRGVSRDDTSRRLVQVDISQMSLEQPDSRNKNSKESKSNDDGGNLSYIRGGNSDFDKKSVSGLNEKLD